MTTIVMCNDGRESRIMYEKFVSNYWDEIFEKNPNERVVYLDRDMNVKVIFATRVNYFDILKRFNKSVVIDSENFKDMMNSYHCELLEMECY